MPIVYVTPDPPFNGQDAPLTALQHDTNVKTLVDGLAALQAAFDAAIFLVDPFITSSGNIVTFHLSNDDTVNIAFDLPSFNYRGAWLPITAYQIGDIFTVAGSGVFLVLVGHTSAATFDPEETEEGTDGDLLYGLLLPEPDFVRVMKWKGGTFPAEQALSVYDVFADASYGTFIVNVAHTSADTFDPWAVDEDDQRLYTKIAPPAFSPVEAAAVTTDGEYVVTRADTGKYLRLTETANITFSDDEFDAGTEVHFEQADADPFDFIETTDITILPQREGFATASPYQGAVITAKFIGDGTWKLIGPHGDEITA